MGYTFICGLCKQEKNIVEVKHLILLNAIQSDAFMDRVCTVCYWRIHSIMTNRKLEDKHQKQLDTWSRMLT